MVRTLPINCTMVSVIDQGSSSPVLGDVAEESMLDLVPLGRAGRKVRDADREARAVGESLEFQLPESSSIAIASATVSGDEQFRGIGVGLLAHVAPPPGDGLDGELWGVMVDAHADPCGVRREIVDAVGNRLAELLVDEVVHADGNGLTGRLPLAPGVLEIADEFLLLRIDGDDGSAPRVVLLRRAR